MFDSLHNATLSGPRIVIESLLEHFIFLNFLGGGPPNPPHGEVKQILNDLPKIIQNYILSSSIIKMSRRVNSDFFYLMLSFCLTIRGHICPVIPINDN